MSRKFIRNVGVDEGGGQACVDQWNFILPKQILCVLISWNVSLSFGLPVCYDWDIGEGISRTSKTMLTTVASPYMHVVVGPRQDL